VGAGRKEAWVSPESGLVIERPEGALVWQQKKLTRSASISSEAMSTAVRIFAPSSGPDKTSPGPRVDRPLSRIVSVRCEA